MQEQDLETVRRVAALSRLALDDRELAGFARDFGRTLEHFRALVELDVEGVEPTTGAARLSEVTREDAPRPSLAPDRLLANAPVRVDDFYSVPKTVGGDE